LHLTTPGLRPDEWNELSPLLSHISFNSLSQYQRFLAIGINSTSIGLRVNPKLSFLNDNRFDPCRPHSKLGVDIDELWQTNDLKNIKGLQLHTVFRVLTILQSLKQLKNSDSILANNWHN